MNQPELAELLGVAVSTVSRIRSGDRRPSIDLMLVIRDKMDWSIDDQIVAMVCDGYPAEFNRRMEEMECPRTTSPSTTTTTDPAEFAEPSSPDQPDADTGNPAL